MTLSQWLIFILVVQLIHGLGTWKLYSKAGKKPWEAFVPVYNAVVLMKIINRPWWWVILLFIPIINLLMFPILWIETIRSFGRNSNQDTVLVLATLGFYIYYVNYVLDVQYIQGRSLKPRTAAGEWVSSIAFAVIAATLVHTYFMQPYTIPTSSLEKSLLIGDFLFVSKFHYGARIPMTTVAAPMVHDTLPLVKTRSYFKKPQLPYFRLPALQQIKQNDIVVFSWPVDTVEQFFKRTNRRIRKPIDKKSNYVKRCVGLPGDSLEIRDGYVYINGKRNELPDRARLQFFYEANTDGQTLPVRSLQNRYHVREGGRLQDGNYILNLSDEDAELLKKNPLIISLERKISPSGDREEVFPNVASLNWNRDNYGPIFIPAKGATVELNAESLPFYRQVIREYEKKTLEVIDGQIFIGGDHSHPVTEYTFEQDYYWMMGDNRHNSEDSRYWGFVPHDHVVGKPVFIWFSWDANGQGLSKVRWDRLFSTVGGEGKRVSYFFPFVGLMAVLYVLNWFRKRRKGEA